MKRLVLALPLMFALGISPAAAQVELLAHVLFALAPIGTKSKAALCSSKYKTYNVATGTFTGKDGKKYRCVVRKK